MSAINDTSRVIWLLLLSQGGWWSPREVDAELGLTPGTAGIRLQKLKLYSAVKHRPGTQKPARGQYSVNRDCCVPQSISIGEIAGALSMAQEATPSCEVCASRRESIVQTSAQGCA